MSDLQQTERHDPELPGGPPPTNTGVAPPKDREAGLWADAWRELKGRPTFMVPLAIIALLSVVAAFPGLFTDVDPNQCLAQRALVRPSFIATTPDGIDPAIFGYDLQGCDYYARMIYGARVSMVIGLAVTGFAFLISLFLGSLAGYYGGWVDSLISRVTDVVLGIPLLLFALVMLTAYTTRFGGRPLIAVVSVLVLLGWTTMTRLVRSQVISLREADFVDAARTLGASDGRIILKHILPNAIAPVIVVATINIGVVIAAEATLTFLNIGLQAPSISWGIAITTAQRRIGQAPHLLFFPGLFLSMTVLSFILMGDALRDALDPKLR